MKSCPECMGEIPDEALVCQLCGERIEGRRCPRCQSMCREEAAVCRWCSYGFKPEGFKPEGFEPEAFEPAGRVVDLEPFSIKAEQLPTIAFRFRLLPQELHFSTDKITVSTPGLFYLWVKEEEIPWHKIAGFKYRDGIFWDTVHIETRGQSASEVKGLHKEDGAIVREILQQLEQ